MEGIPLDEKVFAGRDKYVKREKEIEVPELNALMDVKEDQVVTMLIRQIELDEYLSNQGEVIDLQRNIIEGFIEAIASKNMVEDRALELFSKSSPALKNRIGICEAGIVKPKMKRSDLMWLCNYFPIAIIKISNEIMSITEKGGVKKNSSG